MTFRTILWTLTLGVAAATLIVYYNSRFLGRFVRALLQIDATSPETAVSAEELKIKLSPAVKFSLRPGTSFSQTVLTTEDGRYYISPSRVSLAKAKYRGKDTTIVFVLIIFVILGIFSLAISYLFPNLLDFAGGQFSGLFGNRR